MMSKVAFLSAFLLGLLLAHVSVKFAHAKSIQIAAPGGGEVRGLIIGINNYSSPEISTLKGAVADARDLEGTLRSAGVSDLTVFLDLAATRQKTVAAMERLIGSSKSGDLAIILFAGHGTQLPELIKGSEPDGMDEVFLLTGFSRKGPGTAERIVDDEFNAWLFRLKAKGVDVLFIADTCHGGGLLRLPDFRISELTYRSNPTAPLIDDDLKPISTASDANLKASDLPNVTFLAAVDKHSKAPEIVIPGMATKRGALTYSIARMIERGQTGPVTREMLFSGARQIVYQYADTQQTIYTEPSSKTGDLKKVAFRLSGEAEDTNSGERTEIRVRVVGGAEQALSRVSPRLFKLKAVSGSEIADLTWDASRGDVLNSVGDFVAKCQNPEDLSAIVDRTGAVVGIARMAERMPQAAKLVSGDKRYRKGQDVVLQVEDVSQKYLVLLDLNGDGTVQFLYPKLREDAPKIAERTFVLRFHAGEPFGADHLIAITSDQRLHDLEAALSGLDRQKAPAAAFSAISRARESQGSVRIGFSVLFTDK
jgi:hypothetical protein